MRRSITTRLVVMFALAAFAVFALIGATLHGVLQGELRRHQDDELDTSFQSTLYSLQRVGDLGRWGRFREKLDTLTPADERIRFWVLADDPVFRYGSELEAVRAAPIDARGRAAVVLPASGRRYRMHSVQVDGLGARPTVRLVVGVDASQFSNTLRTFEIALAMLTAGGTLLVMLLGYWIARVGLHPLVRLSDQARALGAKTRSQRLSAERLPVELSDLSASFNGALDRLEAAYGQLEAFNADVAHELRTPLANLIGGTQVALARQRPVAELQEVLESNLEELERLRSIINDMLFLARADQGEAATGLTEASVAQEVEKTIDFFEPIIDETGSSVALEGELDARAAMNVALFRRALSNLLQNAIQHAPGARLEVGIERRAGKVWISVSNPGAPIEAAHLPRLFDRFYRVDVARHDEGDLHGHGLGLAIVKAVAAMHGGNVFAASENGRTTIAFSVLAS